MEQTHTFRGPAPTAGQGRAGWAGQSGHGREQRPGSVMGHSCLLLLDKEIRAQRQSQVLACLSAPTCDRAGMPTFPWWNSPSTT